MGSSQSQVGNQHCKPPPNTRLHPRVWRTPFGGATAGKQLPEQEEWPELFQRTPDFGLALSGGGIRASSESLGILKALHAIKILDEDGKAVSALSKIRYMSTNSGSSWLSVPFCFLPESGVSVDEFLGGGPLGPEKLTLEVLDEAHGKYMGVLFDANPTKQLEQYLLKDVTQLGSTALRAWSRMVSEVYLGPFNISEENAVMCMPEGTAAHKRCMDNVKDKKCNMCPLRKDAPFPIVCGSTLDRGLCCTCCCSTLCQRGEGYWFPMEFTPLYCGFPMLDDHATHGPLGGGVVESFAFGCDRPDKVQGNGTQIADREEVEVLQTHWVPPGMAAGVSSAAPYVNMMAGVKTQKLLGGPSLKMFSAADIQGKNNGPMTLGDGGATDNIGILPLVRRKVKTIFVHIAEASEVNNEDFTKTVWWPSLFGCAEIGMWNIGWSADELNKRSQVFKKEDYAKLLKGLQDAVKDGGAPMAEISLEVLPNMHAGVVGGYTARTVWIVPAVMSSFRKALPAETQKVMGTSGSIQDIGDMGAEGKKVMLNHTFPMVPTFYGHYEGRLVQMLAESTAYNLLHGANQLDPEGGLAKYFGTKFAEQPLKE